MNKLQRNNVHPLYRTIILLMIPLFVTGCSLKSNKTQSTNATAASTLSVWRHKGSTDTEEKAFQAILDQYEATTGIDVIYRAFEPTEDYEKAVINSLAAGTGPDVWEIRNDELPRHKSKLQPMDLTPAVLEHYQKNFARTITQELVSDNKIYGFPLAIDPLVLFYNLDHFQEARVQEPPKTWKETIELANKLTVKENNVVVRPGLALGTASNIDRASDVLQLLMLQFNTQMVDPAKKTATFDLYVQDPETKQFTYPGKTAFALYQSFAHPDSPYRSWSSDQAYTTQLFTQGKLSMMINYLSLSPQITSLNKDLDFSIAGTPQWVTKKIPVGDLPAEVSDPVYFGKYNALVVSKPSLRLSQEQQAAQTDKAWQFIGYATKSENNKAYTNATLLLGPAISGTDAVTDPVKRYLTTWYKGPSPRTVDTHLFNMIQAVTEKGQSLDEVISQTAQAVSRLLQ